MANILQAEGLWAGCKLAKCSWEAQLHFPRIYVYSDHYACFEMDKPKMYGTIYVKALEYVSLDLFKSFLIEYETNGLLFTWTQQGKRFGYFPGPSAGRLAAPSLRHKRQTPEPPIEELMEYCSKFNIFSDSVLDAYPIPSQPIGEAYPHGRTKYKDKDKDNNNSGALPVDKPVDNSSEIENDSIAQKIDEYRDKLYLTYWKEVHKWSLAEIRKKTKPKAILFTLMYIEKTRPANPWGYAQTCLKDYNDSKYLKKDNVYKDIVEKLKLL